MSIKKRQRWEVDILDTENGRIRKEKIMEDNTAKIYFTTDEVMPGGYANYVISPTKHFSDPSPSRVFLLRRVVGHDEVDDLSFRVMSFKTRGADGMSAPVGDEGARVSQTDDVEVMLQNVSDVSRSYHGILVGELLAVSGKATESGEGGVDSLSEGQEEETGTFSVRGLLGRCWAWFGEGAQRALADRSGPGSAGVDASLLSPPRARDTLRRLLADLADAASIPLRAASLYWSSLGEPQGESAGHEVAVGFGPVSVGPGLCADVRVQFCVPFQLTGLVISPSNAHCFEVLDIRVGKNSQLPASGPIHGSVICQIDGGVLPAGIDVAGPGQDVVVRVKNVAQSVIVCQGVLVGLVA
jgi:hypothetical protein